MAGMNELTKSMAIRRQLAETPAKRVDEQNHQRAPKAVMYRPGHTIGVARGCRRIEGCCPYPCCSHTGSAHAKTYVMARNHKAGSIFFFFANQQGEQIGAAIKADQQNHDCQY